MNVFDFYLIQISLLNAFDFNLSQKALFESVWVSFDSNSSVVVAKPNNLVMDVSLVQDVASCIDAMRSIYVQQDIQSFEFLVVLIN